MRSIRHISIIATMIILFGPMTMNIMPQSANAMVSGSPGVAIPPSIGIITHPVVSPPVIPPSEGSSPPSNSTTSPVPAAVDYFLKIDGIQGGSQITGETGAIDIESFQWGAVNPNNPNFQNDLNTASTGQITNQDITITKHMDKASPQLFLACANGQHIANIEIDGLANLGRGPQEFLKMTLTDVIISSYQLSGSNSELPMESISFNFAKIDQPQWDQTVLQEMADNKMAMAIYMKYTDLAKTALTAPTPKPSNGNIEYTLHTSGQPSSIEINSFQWGVTNKDGKVSQLPFTFTPKTGTPTSFVTVNPPDALDIQKVGGAPFVSFSFGKATLSSGQTGTMSTVNPAESLSLNFQAIYIQYGPVKVGWNLQANTPINAQQLTPSAVQPHKTYQIPSFVHNVAKLWAKGQIDDATFEMALQYLIDKGIVHVPMTNQTSEQASGGLPNWVRNLAGYYGNNQISDNTFGQAIEYMLDHGIIKINKLANAMYMKY